MPCLSPRGSSESWAHWALDSVKSYRKCGETLYTPPLWVMCESECPGYVQTARSAGGIKHDAQDFTVLVGQCGLVFVLQKEMPEIEKNMCEPSHTSAVHHGFMD